MNPLDLTIWIYLVSVVIEIPCLASARQKQHKRQIYREQVLPALGGKIPEDAFRTDRLALNRLNKDGIAVIGGVLLEARGHDKNPDNVRSKPEIIQVYVPPEGRYHGDHPKSIDTTYVIRKPVGDHRDDTEQTRTNGISTLPAAVQPDPTTINGLVNVKTDRGNTNPGDKVTGYVDKEDSGILREPVLIPPRGLTPPKTHRGYVNFDRFQPVILDNRLVQRHRHYQTIYKPIVTPLVIPAREIVFTKPYHRSDNNYYNQYNRYPSWDLTYDWNSFYQPTPQPLIFLEDSGNLFLDSHQSRIGTDYEGFFNAIHGRSYRHVGSSSNKGGRSDGNFLNNSEQRIRGKNAFATDQRRPTDVRNEKSDGHVPSSTRKSSSSYTDLASVPETSFSCAGKRGTFADVETKCQVFHECSGWSRTSSLCPAGTAYSSTKKRCEWWNTVTCGFE